MKTTTLVPSLQTLETHFAPDELQEKNSTPPEGQIKVHQGNSNPDTSVNPYAQYISILGQLQGEIIEAQNARTIDRDLPEVFIDMNQLGIRIDPNAVKAALMGPAVTYTLCPVVDFFSLFFPILETKPIFRLFVSTALSAFFVHRYQRQLHQNHSFSQTSEISISYELKRHIERLCKLCGQLAQDNENKFVDIGPKIFQCVPRLLFLELMLINPALANLFCCNENEKKAEAVLACYTKKISTMTEIEKTEYVHSLREELSDKKEQLSEVAKEIASALPNPPTALCNESIMNAAKYY